MLTSRSVSKSFPTILHRSLSVIAAREAKSTTEIKEGTNYLELRCENGTSNFYPWIFLRDNCQCEKCFHPATKQRLLDTAFDVHIDIKPHEVVQNENDEVVLKWADGHISKFSHKWLLDRAFPNSDSEIECKSKCGLNPKLWDNELQNNIPKNEYKDVISDDNATLSWLESIATTGLTLIKNAPARSGVIFEEMTRKVGGFVRKTHYG